jgi:hypothetical protein
VNRQAHFEAILTRARSRPNLIVHDTKAPLNEDGTPVRASYVVLHDLGADKILPGRYTEAQTAETSRVNRVVGRCVGEDAAAVRRIVSALSAQLVGFAPSVGGRVCWPLIVDHEGEIEDDTTVKPPIPYADVDFTYRTQPGG